MAGAAKNKKSKKVKKKVTKKSAAAKGGKSPKKVALKKKAAPLKAIPKGKVSMGGLVPAFQALGTGGEITSSGLRGKKVVLFFYPKDATPGCTLEGRDFTKLHSQFRAANAEVYGISRDSLKSHENFCAKQGYSINLLTDEDEKLCGLFGVIKMKNMYGNKVRGIERSTFVIDVDGKLVKEWRGVKVDGHAEEVLNYIKELGA